MVIINNYLSNFEKHNNREINAVLTDDAMVQLSQNRTCLDAENHQLLENKLSFNHLKKIRFLVNDIFPQGQKTSTFIYHF